MDPGTTTIAGVMSLFLLRKQYRVVTYDRRGHSASTAPPGQGHLRDDVTDALN